MKQYASRVSVARKCSAQATWSNV